MGQFLAKNQLRTLGAALNMAEEVVSDHYHLTDGFWLKNPYEMRTQAWLNLWEVEPAALAQTLRLRRPPSQHGQRPRDFFRICLQDDNFLRVVRRGHGPRDFWPLAVYVLTHELVHVVRFARFEHLYQAGPEDMAREEQRVHALTTGILKDQNLPNLDRVIKSISVSIAS